MAREWKSVAGFAGCTQQSIADQYGVHSTLVSQIVRNKVWRAA